MLTKLHHGPKNSICGITIPILEYFKDLLSIFSLLRMPIDGQGSHRAVRLLDLSRRSERVSGLRGLQFTNG